MFEVSWAGSPPVTSTRLPFRREAVLRLPACRAGWVGAVQLCRARCGWQAACMREGQAGVVLKQCIGLQTPMCVVGMRRGLACTTEFSPAGHPRTASIPGCRWGRWTGSACATRRCSRLGAEGHGWQASVGSRRVRRCTGAGRSEGGTRAPKPAGQGDWRACSKAYGSQAWSPAPRHCILVWWHLHAGTHPRGWGGAAPSCSRSGHHCPGTSARCPGHSVAQVGGCQWEGASGSSCCRG